MTRELLALVLACTAALVGAAVVRVQLFAAISPADLAFFTQSAWSAAHGRDFAQTVLSFDGSSLLGSVHLSPVRLLQVPAAAVGPAGLVALQALAVGAGLGAVAVLARGAGASPAVAAVAVVAATLHPLTQALAAVDARPIVFMVPAGLWAAAGLQQGRRSWLVAGGLLAIAAREEAPLLLAALLPWAAGRRRADLGLLLVLIGLAVALPLLVWGHGGTLSANEDLGGTVAAIAAGERPVLRDPDEGRFLLLCVVGALPALLAPRLVLPALGGWLWLLVFSTLEPARPEGGGLHYLAPLLPLLLAGLAVGLARLRGRAVVGGAVALAALAGGPVIARTVDQLAARGGLAEARRTLLAPIVEEPGGALAEAWAAPHLARRELLLIPGNFEVAEGELGAVVAGLDWAVLDGGLAERASWRDALVEAGFRREATGGGAERWARPR